MRAVIRGSTSAPANAGTVEHAVLSTIAYADVFDYPLRPREVHRLLHGIHATRDATETALVGCSTPGGPLTHLNGYYMLRGRESLVDVRRERAARSARVWPAAIRFGRMIAAVPFVRMVAVTGSLVWDNVDEEGDIDYLIVTEAGHLWTSRWLVAALGRAGRLTGKVLCPNYMVSKRALLLGERNLYGAYELACMTPIVGRRMYERLRQANGWVEAFLPNATDTPRPPAVAPREARGLAQRVIGRLTRFGERALRSSAGAALERYEMQYRIRKRRDEGPAEWESSYGLDWYKRHAGGHRERVLTAFNERLKRVVGGMSTGVS